MLLMTVSTIARLVWFDFIAADVNSAAESHSTAREADGARALIWRT